MLEPAGGERLRDGRVRRIAHQHAIGEVRHDQEVAFGEGGVRGEGGDDLLARDDGVRDAGGAHRRSQHGDVDPVGLELGDELRGEQFAADGQRDVLELPRSFPQDARHDPVGRRAGEPEADGALQTFADAAHVVLDRLELLEHPASALEQQLAGGVHRDVARGAGEQFDSQESFELADLLRQRRLRHPEALGRPAEVVLLGDGDEVAEMPRLEHTASSHPRRNDLGEP